MSDAFDAAIDAQRRLGLKREKETPKNQMQAEAEPLRYPELPKTRTDLGYKWEPALVEDVLMSFCKFLKRNDARAFMMDVYATGDKVYRNMLIQLPKKGLYPPETISIQFNRESGRQFSLLCEMEA